MNRTVTIELFKEGMKFSAGHFTVFSATERENLHGHNFSVYVALTSDISDNGMCFDYGIYKKRIMDICGELNEVFILPSKSPYLKIEESGNNVYVKFNDEIISFLKRDVLILPVQNATVEEFSYFILQKLIADEDELREFKIQNITVKVFSGPGQCASVNWITPGH